HAYHRIALYLKSLQLQGFKTFARRTELPFSRGITAIVGPNGSGKSNLVDAIRWALGERNARGLRGQRMEDVIYSGGPGKSAVGMAEVMLTIDNADQRLNVEFNEIEVARRLYRSGESEYLINGARARLKDIDALLASTGLRQDGYAVTAQNDIDFVIQAAPGLRRELIEEAAGAPRRRRPSPSLNRSTRSTARHYSPPARRAGVTRKRSRTCGFVSPRASTRRASPRSATLRPFRRSRRCRASSNDSTHRSKPAAASSMSWLARPRAPARTWRRPRARSRRPRLPSVPRASGRPRPRQTVSHANNNAMKDSEKPHRSRPSFASWRAA